MQESQKPPPPVQSKSFVPSQQAGEPKENQGPVERVQISSLKEKEEKQVTDTMTPRHHDTATPPMTPTNQPTHHDANQRTWVPESEEEYIEVIRKAVKQVGKEGGTYRFTLDEKTAMKQIRRHYEDQGVDTSDIEIIRMGLNYILEDFRKRGEKSLLANVMKRLKE